MKIESVALSSVQTAQADQLLVINAEQIRTILYLGIKGFVRSASNAEHTVDTYA